MNLLPCMEKWWASWVLLIIKTNLEETAISNYKNKNKIIHYAPHTLSTGARKMETPVRTNTSMPVILCSLYVWHWWDTRERQVSFTMLSSTSATKDLGLWFCSSVMLVVAAYLTNCTFLFISELFVFMLLWTDLTPRNCGCSPGALDSLSIFRDSMWAIEMTVAATYQGRPKKEHVAIRTPTQNRSRW